MTISPMAVATLGFRAPNVYPPSVAANGFLFGLLGAPFLDIEIIGTPIDMLASMAVMADTPVPALGIMVDALDSRNILQENAYALGDIADAPLAALGMITDSLPLEDVAGDLNIEALGAIAAVPIDTEDGMADKLDTRDIITEDPEDAEGEMTDAAIDVEGEMA